MSLGHSFAFHLIQFNSLQSNSIYYRDGVITLDSTLLLLFSWGRLMSSLLKAFEESGFLLP